MLEISQITLPAMFLAGLQASTHCVLMCGVYQLSVADRPGAWWQQQTGRVLMYVALGLLAGGAGAWLSVHLPQGTEASWIRGVLGIAILGFAVWQFKRPRHHCPATRRQSFTSGLLWGLMPCPMLYMALFVAGLSASVWFGGALMLAFALGTVPGLAAQMWVFAKPLATLRGKMLAQPAYGAVLLSLSAAVVFFSAWYAVPQAGILCRP